ncbi:MAG: tetratricopeptide repeat protein [Gammaproteobacteria bacterium]
MPDNNLNPNDLLKQGQEAYREKDYEAAIASYTQALSVIKQEKLNPEEDTRLLSSIYPVLENALHNALLLTHIQTRKLDLALNNLTDALKIDSNNAGTYLNGGKLYQYKGDYPEALKYYQKAINLKDNQAHFYKGQIHYALSQYKEALNEYIKGYAHLNPAKKQAIEHDISSILQKSANYLLEIPKKDLLGAIMLLPTDKKIAVLTECLDKKTVLGERFHKKEGLTACSIDKKGSNLGKAYAELMKLKPDFTMEKLGTSYQPTPSEPNPEPPQSSKKMG